MILRNLFLRASVAVLLLFLVGQSANAQNVSRLNRYTVTTFSGSFTELSSSYSSYGSGDDNTYTFGSLGFAFNYDSVSLNSGTTLYVSTNGTLAIGGSNTCPGCCSDYACNTSYPMLISPYSYDMYTTGGLYNTGALGSSPNRYQIFEWSNIRAYSGSNATSFEVVIYETKNRIELIYKDHSYNLQYGGGIGLSGTNTGGFQSLRYSSGSSTPSTDIRYDPAAPPIPPAQLSVNPHAINFGGLNAGTSTTSTVTVYSVGSNTLKFTGGYSITGAPDYTMLTYPNINDSIQPGQSRTYTVQFAPAAPGNRNATLTFYTNGRDSGVQNVSLAGIGLAPGVTYGATALFHRVSRKLGDTSAVQYIPIKSSGTGPLSINSVYMIGMNPDNYKVSRMPQNPLPVGVQDSIGIRFTPKYEGRPDCYVVINTNAFNIPWDTVSLWGIGTLPRLTVAPPTPTTGSGTNVTMGFDSVALGDSVCRSITLTNSGSDTLRFVKQVLVSADYDYSYYGLTGSDTALLPGQSRLVSVCFHPLRSGTRVATLRLFTNIPATFESPARDTSSFVVNIVGVGAAFGRFMVTGPTTDSVIVGQTSSPCMIDTVWNTGQTDITVSGATLAGSSASEYALTWTGSAPPFVLAAGAHRTVQVCFTPADRGPRPASIRVTGSTSGEVITDSVQLNGYGLHMCATPNPLAIYDTVLVGQQDRKTITVQNCGDVATTDSATFGSASSTEWALNSSAVVGPVAPAGNATYSVLFAPNTLGAAVSTLYIAPVAGTQVQLNGFGTGVLAVGSSKVISVPKGTCDYDTVVFTNNGNIDWTPGSVSLSGAYTADFTVIGTTTTPATIAPGASGYIVLKFCPSALSGESVTVDFPSSSPAANVVTGSQVPYSLVANGTASVATHYQQDGFVLGQSYPNPTAAVATAMVTLPKDASVNVNIVDATGSVVRNAFAGRLSAGEHAIDLDGKGLASGTYYVILTSGDIHLVREMVVVK